jgi:hypothetical protein
MMKLLIILTLFLSLALAHASEDYQIKNVIGNWSTMDGVWQYWELQISQTQNPKMSLLKYCDPFKLSTTGICDQVLPNEGEITFSIQNGRLSVEESPGSANHLYEMEIDESNPNVLIRYWGSTKIKYFRN